MKADKPAHPSDGRRFGAVRGVGAPERVAYLIEQFWQSTGGWYMNPLDTEHGTIYIRHNDVLHHKCE